MPCVFRWVPSTIDSVYPFIIGFLEFLLIELLGHEQLGLWLIFNAVIFGIMVWVSHTTMRRARHDGDNDALFSETVPATVRDFLPHIIAISTIFLCGVYFALF